MQPAILKQHPIEEQNFGRLLFFLVLVELIAVASFVVSGVVGMLHENVVIA